MELPDPCRPSILDWRVKEDDLILYPDFMHDRLENHMVFQELQTHFQRGEVQSLIQTYLLIFHPLVSSSLTAVGVTSCIPIVRPVKL